MLLLLICKHDCDMSFLTKVDFKQYVCVCVTNVILKHTVSVKMCRRQDFLKGRVEKIK